MGTPAQIKSSDEPPLVAIFRISENGHLNFSAFDAHNHALPKAKAERQNQPAEDNPLKWISEGNNSAHS